MKETAQNQKQRSSKGGCRKKSLNRKEEKKMNREQGK